MIPISFRRSFLQIINYLRSLATLLSSILTQAASCITLCMLRTIIGILASSLSIIVMKAFWIRAWFSLRYNLRYNRRFNHRCNLRCSRREQLRHKPYSNNNSYSRTCRVINKTIVIGTIERQVRYYRKVRMKWDKAGCRNRFNHSRKGKAHNSWKKWWIIQLILIAKSLELIKVMRMIKEPILEKKYWIWTMYLLRDLNA